MATYVPFVGLNRYPHVGLPERPWAMATGTDYPNTSGHLGAVSVLRNRCRGFRDTAHHHSQRAE